MANHALRDARHGGLENGDADTQSHTGDEQPHPAAQAAGARRKADDHQPDDKGEPWPEARHRRRANHGPKRQEQHRQVGERSDGRLAQVELALYVWQHRRQRQDSHPQIATY